MNSLEKELKKRGLTFYRLMQLLGMNPHHKHGSFVPRIKGDVAITPEELFHVCSVIESETNKPLNPNDLNLKVNSYIIK